MAVQAAIQLRRNLQPRNDTILVSATNSLPFGHTSLPQNAKRFITVRKVITIILTLTPNINGGRIIRAPEDQLRRPIISTTNVTHIRFPPHQSLGTPKITQFQLLILRVY